MENAIADASSLAPATEAARSFLAPSPASDAVPVEPDTPETRMIQCPLWDDLQAARKRHDELVIEWTEMQAWFNRAQAKYDTHVKEVIEKEKSELKSDDETQPAAPQAAAPTAPPQAAPAPDPWQPAAALLPPRQSQPAPAAATATVPRGMSQPAVSQTPVANPEFQALSMQITALKDLFMAGQSEIASLPVIPKFNKQSRSNIQLGLLSRLCL